MDSEIDQLASWTSGLMERLDTIDYEEMAAKIEERQFIVDRIRSKLISEEQRERYHGKMMQILQHDEVIMNRLNELMSEALGGTRKMNTVRHQKSAYQTNYSLDGVFFDKKK